MMQQRSPSTTPIPRRRTHLKPSQVAVLQESFVTNSLPDSTIRSRLARELGVSERTVQIWFQNRRAKARKLEAYSDGQGMTTLVPNVRTGWVDIPPPSKPLLSSPSPSSSSHPSTTFRQLMTPERFEELNPNRRPRSQSTHPTSSTMVNNNNNNKNVLSDHSSLSTHTRAMSEGNDPEVLQITLPTNTLRIGTWARYASLTTQNDLDLQCICFPFERLFVWQIEDCGHKFRIEVDMNQIHQIRLRPYHPSSSTLNHQDSNQLIGQLEFEIYQVRFSMSQIMNSHQQDLHWIRCGDFSENRQATLISTHVLHGNYNALKQTFIDLISMVPDLSPKFTLPPPSLDFSNHPNCRDLTLSPSATPEPSHSSSLLFHHVPSTSSSTIGSSFSNAMMSTIPTTTNTTNTSTSMDHHHHTIQMKHSPSSSSSSSSLLDDHHKHFISTTNDTTSPLMQTMTSTTTQQPITTTTSNTNNPWYMDSKMNTSYDHFPPSLDQMQTYYMQMFQPQPTTSMFM
ncbi:unnamed protein product [Cunninghamella blakesleeana]